MTSRWKFVGIVKLRKVFPEKFAAVEDAAGAHVEEIHGEHLVLEVIAEDVGIVAFDGGDTLLLLQLFDSGDEVTIFGGALELLRVGRLGHAVAKRADEISLAALEKKLYVANSLGVDLGRGEVFHARTETALDVVLQARARMEAREVDLAGGDEKVAMNEIDDAIGKVGGEVGSVIDATVFAQAARDIDAREALAESEFDVGVCFIVAQKDVEAGLLLLDEVVFKGESLFIVGDDNVVDIDGLADESAGLGVFPAAFMEIRAYARAEVFRLADVNDLALGIFVEIDAGGDGETTDFGEEVHRELSLV